MWSHSFCDIYGICGDYGLEDGWVNGSSCGLLLIIRPLAFFFLKNGKRRVIFVMNITKYSVNYLFLA